MNPMNILSWKRSRGVWETVSVCGRLLVTEVENVTQVQTLDILDNPPSIKRSLLTL